MKILRLLLRPLLFFLYLFSSLLINARWYTHFVFRMITSYLVSVPLFKGHRGLVHSCSFAC